jgi:hypothetical protein
MKSIFKSIKRLLGIKDCSGCFYYHKYFDNGKPFCFTSLHRKMKVCGDYLEVENK